MKKKNRSRSGKHLTPRRNVGLPEPWFQVAQQLASKGPTPVTWWLCQLIRREAEAAGITSLPPMPWQQAAQE